MHPVHSPSTSDGLWVPIAELAKLKGVSRQSMHERVTRLEALGALVIKTGTGRARLVNLAEFDRAAGETNDAVRALNGTGAASTAADPILAKEQARRAAYDADLKQLDLEERLGKLIPVADVQKAMTACAEVLVRAIEQITSRADEVAAAVGKDGTPGARSALKGIARSLRDSLAQAMRLQADASDQPEEQS